MMKLEEILEGAIGQRGRFTGYKPPNEKGEIKKDATYEHFPMDWDLHFSGEETLGISPVKIIQDENGSKGLCRWIAFDMDVEDEPQEFCKEVVKISDELFPYMSSSGRWHLHLYLDTWINVDEARKKAVAIETKLKKKWGKGVDTSHTLPKAYTINEIKPGYWLFMPYSNNKKLTNSNLVCYSPSGNPLTKSQVEFRYHWRKHLLIACSVGTTEGQGGREPFLFKIAQEIKVKDLDLTLEEVNQQFNDRVDVRTLDSWERGINKSLANEETYTEEFLVEHYETYLKEINGFWRKDLENRGVFKGTKHEAVELTDEQKELQKQFYENVIYIKLDDKWYDKKYGSEYKQTAIKVTYGSYFEGDVIKTFSNNPKAQLVEKTIYRPDLYKNNEDPVVIDEEGLHQLNNYRPSGVEAIEPKTPKHFEELEMFKQLITKLTKHEGTGIDVNGNEIQLYDYVLDHLSMPFQRTGEKVRSSIVLHSTGFQVGKSTIFKIMRKALGINNATIIKPENATARELGFLENQCVFIDEIKIDGSIEEKYSVMNKMKPLMTEELHDCRPLFKDWRVVHSTANFMLSTNFKNAMAVEENEARYTCIDIGKTRDELGGDSFYRPLYEAYKHGTLSNVVKWFLSTREISSTFIPENPCLKTNFLKVMSREGGHPVLPEVETIFKEGAKPFNQSLIAFGETWKYLKKDYKIKARDSDFKKALVSLGCETVGECKHKISKRKVTLLIIKNHEFFTDKTKSEMVNKYWVPLDADAPNETSDQIRNKMTPDQIKELDYGQGEIQRFEDFRFDDKDPDEDVAFEEIRKRRKS